jgi:hypothetical protein
MYEIYIISLNLFVDRFWREQICARLQWFSVGEMQVLAIVSGKRYCLNLVRHQSQKHKILIASYCLHVKLTLYSAVSQGTNTYKMKCTTFVPSGFLKFENGGKGLQEF